MWDPGRIWGKLMKLILNGWKEARLCNASIFSLKLQLIKKILEYIRMSINSLAFGILKVGMLLNITT